jgi:hypothetical protein
VKGLERSRTGCEGLTVRVELVMFGKFGTGKQGTDIGKCSSVKRAIKTGTNYLQKR